MGGNGSGNVAPSVGGKAQFSNGVIGGNGGPGDGLGEGGSAADYSVFPTYTGSTWCFAVGGGGGGGFGGGGAGGGGSPLDGGGGGGGSFGPTNSIFGVGLNGGSANRAGGNGSLVIVYNDPPTQPPSGPAPRITTFSPSSGWSGTRVAIQGTNLSTATAVTFGGIPATTFKVYIAENFIEAVAPPRSPGATSISVTTPNGTATAAASFTYIEPAPVVAEISNAASYLMTEISPGAIAIIWGNNLGPRNPVTAPAGAIGSLLPQTLDGTSVSIAGYQAPLLYVSESQIGVVVPYETSFASTAPVVVTRNGVRSTAKTIKLARQTLGIFSANSSGTGLAAAVNEDGTTISLANPARPGKIISLFATGEGLLLPFVQAGKFTDQLTYKPQIPIDVYIDNRKAEVFYMGPPPFSFTGFLQINARIPDGIPSGIVPVRLAAEGASLSQKGITLIVENDTGRTAASIEISAGNFRSVLELIGGRIPYYQPVVDVTFKMLTETGFTITQLSIDPVIDWSGKPTDNCTPSSPCTIPPGPVGRSVTFPWATKPDGKVYIEIRGMDANGNKDYFYLYPN